MVGTDMNMYQALCEVAARHPGREALVCGSYRASYGRLMVEIEDVARRLSRLGVGKGDRVATVLHPCPEFIQALFALAWLGGVIVPIDPHFRRRQLIHILSDAEPAGVITSVQVGDETLETVRSWGGASPGLRYVLLTEGDDGSGLCLDERPPTDAYEPTDPSGVGPDDLLALLYTSGTTGLPKGVMHSHRSMIAPIVASLRLRQMWAQRPSLHLMGRWINVLGRYGPRLLRAVGRPQTFLSTVGCHNITGLEVILQALLMGDRLVIMSRFNPIEALRLVGQEQVTILVAVPLAFSVMVRLAGSDRFDLSSLLICGTGSAPCPPDLAHQIQEHFGCAVHIGFGTTELAGGISATSLEDSGQVQAETVGRSMPGMEIKIVDQERRELPFGQVGELACRSDSVMMGYYRAPEKTTQVLDEEGWYYTGDLVMMDEHGYLHIVGRKDDMIIRGGQNIYPAEIEAYLASHLSIQEAAVVGMPRGAGGESVWAFVVLEEGVELTSGQVLRYCREELEACKIPERIEFMAQLPRSSAGKVQKFKLREIALQMREVRCGAR